MSRLSCSASLRDFRTPQPKSLMKSPQLPKSLQPGSETSGNGANGLADRVGPMSGLCS
jgi:hypothetical protein